MIRCTAKAVIICDGKILLNRCVHQDGSTYYDLPGGGQKQYETMEHAFIREVMEETGYTVRVRRLMAVAEEIFTNVSLRERYPDYTHRIMHIFLAELINDRPVSPTELDLDMERSIWIPICEVELLQELHPNVLKQSLADLLHNNDAVYLGCDFIDGEGV